MFASKQSKPSPISFLKMKSTLICLVVWLAIIIGCVPTNTNRYLHHPSFQSLFVIPVHHDDIQNFGETQSWNLQTPLPRLVFQFFMLVTDLGTSCALVHLASVLRRRQHPRRREENRNWHAKSYSTSIYNIYRNRIWQDLFNIKKAWYSKPSGKHVLLGYHAVK